MASYIYPAVFHSNSDGSYTVLFPDLPGCITEGKDLESALRMAQEALHTWMEYTVEHKDPVPRPTKLQDVHVTDAEFVNLICAAVKDDRSVRRNVSIPKWMDEQASAEGLSLSRVLQDALRDRLS